MSGPGADSYHHYDHRQWPQPLTVTPSPAPPPPIPGEIPGHSSIDEVRTIFISGLPGDVKERELLNLLRWLPGFEASQIKSKRGKPIGFAFFSTHQQAAVAKYVLQDMVFDAETECTIHVEIAKRNFFVKRGVGADFSSFDQSKRLRTGGDFAHSSFQSSSPFHPQPVAVWATPGYMTPPAPYDPVSGYPVPQVAIPSLAPVAALSGHAPVQKATLGSDPTPLELHIQIDQHQADQQWLDERSKMAHDDYLCFRDSQPHTIEGSSSGSTSYSDYQAWSQALGGKLEGRVYEISSQASVCKPYTSTSPSQSHMSSQYDKFNQSMTSFTKQIKEIKQMQESMMQIMEKRIKAPRKKGKVPAPEPESEPVDSEEISSDDE